MGRTLAVALAVVVMAAVIVAVDVLFLRDHFWVRLVVNVGIVVICGAIYLSLRGRL